MVNVLPYTKPGKSPGLNKKGRAIIKNYQLYLLLLPALAYLIVFKYTPLYGIQIAFRKYTLSGGITGSEWVGLKHFITFFKSPQFSRLLSNTLILSFYELVVSFPIPVILALLLNQITHKRTKAVLENIFYIPHFISVVVLVGMMTTFFSMQGGIVNTVLSGLGHKKINFMGEASMFRHLYVFSGVWKNAGWNAIIYIAALSGIDQTLHEAAKVDGAGKLARIWHVDIPGILPTIMMMFIMAVGNVMSIGFEKAYLMQNPLNISTSEIIATYVYKVGLQRVQYDYATAIGLFNNVINVILLLVANKVSKRLTDNSLW